MSGPAPEGAETSEMSLDRALREARVAFERLRAEHEQRHLDLGAVRRDGVKFLAEIGQLAFENGRLRETLRALLPHARKAGKAASEAADRAQAILEEAYNGSS